MGSDEIRNALDFVFTVMMIGVVLLSLLRTVSLKPKGKEETHEV